MEETQNIQETLKKIVNDVNEFVNTKLAEHDATDYELSSFEVKEVSKPVDTVSIKMTLGIETLDIQNDDCWLCVGGQCHRVC